MYRVCRRESSLMSTGQRKYLFPVHALMLAAESHCQVSLTLGPKYCSWRCRRAPDDLCLCRAKMQSMVRTTSTSTHVDICSISWTTRRRKSLCRRRTKWCGRRLIVSISRSRLYSKNYIGSRIDLLGLHAARPWDAMLQKQTNWLRPLTL